MLEGRTEEEEHEIMAAAVRSEAPAGIEQKLKVSVDLSATSVAFSVTQRISSGVAVLLHVSALISCGGRFWTGQPPAAVALAAALVGLTDNAALYTWSSLSSFHNFVLVQSALRYSLCLSRRCSQGIQAVFHAVHLVPRSTNEVAARRSVVLRGGEDYLLRTCTA